MDIHLLLLMDMKVVLRPIHHLIIEDILTLVIHQLGQDLLLWCLLHDQWGRQPP
jgi:hypothetical protein